jgi:SAM-dependent methyltransferase
MDLYGEEKYWEARYAGVKDNFDWYQRWICVKDTLAASLRKTDLVLNAGCGISRLAEEMYDDGFERVISVDISPAAVKLLNDKCRHKKEEFRYDVMDIKNLTYEDGKFDAIIDKATLDCFFVTMF